MTSPYEELFDSSVSLEQHNWTSDALAEIPTCKGVLLFVDSNHHPIQLLEAANLRRTAKAKLLCEEPPKNSPPLTEPKVRHIPPGKQGPLPVSSPDGVVEKRPKTRLLNLATTLYYARCYNHYSSQITYIQLAHTIFGKDAADWIQLPKISLATIDTNVFLPFFYVSDTPATKKNQKKFGLFPNRKAALRFTEILNTVFCLCRNPSLVKSGREQSCPYLQMQTCPGPCLNAGLHENYAAAVNRAVQVASGGVETTQQQLQQQMQQSSEQMDFEKANELKKQIEQLKKLQKQDYRWVHDLNNLSVLHADRTVKKSVEGQRKRIRQYQWFKIDAEATYDLGEFSPTSQQEIDLFLEQNWTTRSPIPFAGGTRKHLANLAFFLFRSKRSGLWLDCSDGIMGDRLYTEIENLLGKELPDDCAKSKDAE